MKTFTHCLIPCFALVLASSCARSPSRPQEPTQLSRELAAKLKGGALKFRAFQKANRASELGFLDLRFRDCEPQASASLLQAYVKCTVDIESDTFRTRTGAEVSGDHQNFTVALNASEADRFKLEARLQVEWKDKRWTGNGKVEGSLHRKLASGERSQVDIHESLDF